MGCRNDGAMGAHAGKLQEELDKVTRLLCELVTAIDKEGLRITMSAELARWIKAHREADWKRELEERTRVRDGLQERVTKITVLGGKPGKQLLICLKAAKAAVTTFSQAREGR